MKRLILALAFCLSACATTGGDFTTQATKATMLVDQVTLAADAAVKANVLKGQDAVNTLNTIKAARDGINTAKTMAVTNPSGASTELTWATGLLTATQAFLLAQGATK